VLLLIIFFFISCPTTTHIIARYAWYSGLDPWAPPRRRFLKSRKGKAGPGPSPEGTVLREGP
jgi:multisubunit Na+/H+ antiporter MnhG subunit